MKTSPTISSSCDIAPLYVSLSTSVAMCGTNNRLNVNMHRICFCRAEWADPPSTGDGWCCRASTSHLKIWIENATPDDLVHLVINCPYKLQRNIYYQRSLATEDLNIIKKKEKCGKFWSRTFASWEGLFSFVPVFEQIRSSFSVSRIQWIRKNLALCTYIWCLRETNIVILTDKTRQVFAAPYTNEIVPVNSRISAEWTLTIHKLLYLKDKMGLSWRSIILALADKVHFKLKDGIHEDITGDRYFKC